VICAVSSRALLPRARADLVSCQGSHERSAETKLAYPQGPRTAIQFVLSAVGSATVPPQGRLPCAVPKYSGSILVSQKSFSSSGWADHPLVKGATIASGSAASGADRLPYSSQPSSQRKASSDETQRQNRQQTNQHRNRSMVCYRLSKDAPLPVLYGERRKERTHQRAIACGQGLSRSDPSRARR